MKPAILILGHDSVGKDTIAEALSEHFSLVYERTSLQAAKHIIMQHPKAKEKYANYYDCYEDRGKNRQLWASLIEEYNTPDGAAFAKKVLAENHIYVGMRKLREFITCNDAGIFDIIVWVEGKTTSSEVMEIPKKAAHIVYNNSIDKTIDADKFNRSIKRLFAQIMSKINAPTGEQKLLIEALNKPLKDTSAKKETRPDVSDNSDDYSLES